MSEREGFDVLVVAGGKGGKTLAMDLATSAPSPHVTVSEPPPRRST
jgi:hypothetical protein